MLPNINLMYQIMVIVYNVWYFTIHLKLIKQVMDEHFMEHASTY